MTEAAEGTLLWEPSEEFKENANITRYMRWLKEEKNLSFEDYGELWEWSVTEVEDFWASIWEYFEVKASKPYERVLAEREMSEAGWFEGAELNYAEHVFRKAARPEGPAVLHQSEIRTLSEMSWRSSAATRSGPTCPTLQRPWSLSWPAHLWGPPGRSARQNPGWGAWSTAW